MAEMAKLEIQETISKEWPRFKIIHDKIDKTKARPAVGIQLINNIINGSPSDPTVPPILTGRLRGSGTVFIGGKLIYETPKVDGQGTPNKSYNGKSGEITVGFNTPYAKKWHEAEFIPGIRSEQSGDVGNKYVERHLRSDGKELMKLYALMLKKETK